MAHSDAVPAAAGDHFYGEQFCKLHAMRGCNIT